jgi:hypothetical protein
MSPHPTGGGCPPETNGQLLALIERAQFDGFITNEPFAKLDALKRVHKLAN